MTTYAGPERRQVEREVVPPEETDVIERLLTRLEMLRRVLKDGHLDRELPEGPRGGARA